MEQPDNRLSITDCTEAIYKCKASSVAYLRNHYLPAKPTGRRPSPSTARPAATHEEWFSRKPRAQLVRGDRTRNRILDLLRASGQLREPPNLPNLAQELVSAQLQAKRSGRTAYISPGLLAAPDLSAEYVLNGFAAPGVRWANFSPFLLAVEYLGAEQCWRLAVIDLKSTESLEQAEQLRPSEEFKILAYRFFLYRLLQSFQLTTHTDGNALLLRLSVARSARLVKYTGCFSSSCHSRDCVLNWPLAPSDLEARLRFFAVQDDANSSIVKTVVFGTVPEALGLRRVQTGGRRSSRVDDLASELGGLKF